MKLCYNILDCIGHTPMIKLNKISSKEVEAELWAKAEFMNPTGSVKDRIAYYMIKAAESSGRLRPGMTLVVPTTGNTGIAFSAIGSYLGYRVLIVIPEEMSEERFLLMKLLGADFITVPGGETDALKAMEYAKKIVEENPSKYYLFDQWSDEANVWAHYATTGREILEQLGRVDAWVAEVGTGGTLIGVAKRLKEANPRTIVVGAEPAECPTAAEWFKTGVPGPRGRHEIEGVGDGFVPEIISKYKELIDGFVTVTSDEAINMAKRIAREEGLPVGISSGANVAAAIKVAREYSIGYGARVVTVLPDYAARYFSTRLFRKKKIMTPRSRVLKEIEES